mmetsp:Transcript_46220/g.110149  ORF Transcript_46220/g.110149 Transcript_46220/m.110149 type:complete len:216 (+) Transcript_46220:363-1010(+)
MPDMSWASSGPSTASDLAFVMPWRMNKAADLTRSNSTSSTLSVSTASTAACVRTVATEGSILALTFSSDSNSWVRRLRRWQHSLVSVHTRGIGGTQAGGAKLRVPATAPMPACAAEYRPCARSSVTWVLTLLRTAIAEEARSGSTVTFFVRRARSSRASKTCTPTIRRCPCDTGPLCSTADARCSRPRARTTFAAGTSTKNSKTRGRRSAVVIQP